MNLEEILQQANDAASEASDPASLDQVRVEYLGKKGKITSLLKSLGKLAPEERIVAGQSINLV